MFEFDGNDSIISIDLSHNSINQSDLVVRLITGIMTSFASELKSLDISSNPFVLEKDQVEKLIEIIDELGDELNSNFDHLSIDVETQSNCPDLLRTFLSKLARTEQIKPINESVEDDWEDVEDEEQVMELSEFLKKNKLVIDDKNESK